MELAALGVSIVDKQYFQMSDLPCQALKGVAASRQMKTVPPPPVPDHLTHSAGQDPLGRKPTALEKYAEQLARIESALDRMDAGHYGICTGCNSPISLKRLDADPAVETCSDCRAPATLTS